MKVLPDPHYRHRFPAELISHAVWLYRVFSPSLRDVELLLAERGISVSYETIGRWFGGGFAQAMRRRRPRPGDKWNMDEVNRAGFRGGSNFQVGWSHDEQDDEQIQP